MGKYPAAGPDPGGRHRHEQHPCLPSWFTDCWQTVQPRLAADPLLVVQGLDEQPRLGLSLISGFRASCGPICSATGAAQPGGYSMFTGSREAQITYNYSWGGKARAKARDKKRRAQWSSGYRQRSSMT